MIFTEMNADRLPILLRRRKMNDRFKPGDIVAHFKRETLSPEEKSTNKYLYKIIGEAQHTETKEKLMIYMALYCTSSRTSAPISRG